MLKKRAILITALVTIVVAAVAVFLYAARRPAAVPSPHAIVPPSIHYARDPSHPVTAIHLAAVYFVPKDIAASADASWRDTFNHALAELVRFYEFELHGAVAITYTVYPTPIIGEANHHVYDGGDTNRGNPNALAAVSAELGRRLFTPGGDHYDASFVRSVPGTDEALAILYEGVGSIATLRLAAGEQQAPNPLYQHSLIELDGVEWPVFLVSRFFLTTEGYRDYGETVFAHEFAHLFGLDDRFDADGNPTSDDIMGSGRFLPLVNTYLSLEDKRELGLTY